MSANLPPLPEPHSTRKVWVDGIPSHLFTAEQMFAFRARGLAAQAAEVEALRADAERWRQFRDGDCSVPAGPDYPAHDLVMARLNNATENYVREGSGVADYDAAVDACAARAALKERAPNVGAKLETTAPARN